MAKRNVIASCIDSAPLCRIAIAMRACRRALDAVPKFWRTSVSAKYDRNMSRTARRKLSDTHRLETDAPRRRNGQCCDEMKPPSVRIRSAS